MTTVKTSNCNGSLTCRCSQCDIEVTVIPPSPRLVGIELNPGPKKGLKQALRETARKAATTAAKQVVGHAKSTAIKATKKDAKGQPSLARRGLNFGARTLGNVIGMGDAAESASNFISDILGFGSYSVKQNSIATSCDQIPEFKADATGRLVVRHRECLGNVMSSGAFTTQFSGVINPVNPTMFPWLSSIANNYEQYKFNGLVFMFKSTSASALNSTNTALGTVLMTTQYDAANVLLTDKISMEAYEFTSSNKPSESAMHPIECKHSADVINGRYVREPLASLNSIPPPNTIAFPTVVGASSNSQAPGVAVNITDVGLFQLSTEGMQADTIIGELWVTYDIVLTKPRPAFRGGGTLRAYWSNYTSGTPVTLGANLLANARLVSSQSTIVPGQRGFPQLSSSGRYLSFEGCLPNSVYDITVFGTRISGISSIPAMSATGCTIIPCAFINSAGAGSSFFYANGPNGWTNTIRVRIPALLPSAITYPSVDLGTIAGASPNDYTECVVTQVPVNPSVSFSLSAVSERESLRMLLRELNEEKLVDPVLPDPPCGPPVGPGGGPVNPPDPPTPDVSRVHSDTDIVEVNEDLSQSLHIDSATLSRLLRR